MRSEETEDNKEISEGRRGRNETGSTREREQELRHRIEQQRMDKDKH